MDVRAGVVTGSGLMRDERGMRRSHALAEDLRGVHEVVFETEQTPADRFGAP